MLGADSINLALMVADSGLIDTAVQDILRQPELLMMSERPGVKRSIKKHLKKWHKTVRHKVTTRRNSDWLTEQLALYQDTIYLDEQRFLENVDSIIVNIHPNSSFHTIVHSQRNTMSAHSINFAQSFCRQWYECLKKDVERTQTEALETHKSKLLDELYKRLETLKELERVSEQGESGNQGRLWDLAGAKLTKRDFSRIANYSEFLKKNGDLMSIVKQLGRMAQQVEAPELNRAQCDNLQCNEQPSDFAIDDIVGIHTSDDINKLLPNETMYLAYPELETVFYQHLAEKRLLSYKSEGKQRSVRQVNAPKHDQRSEEKEQGPFIVAIDASASMMGFPERCAKATAYAMMKLAIEQDRECHVIIFSSTFITYDFTGQSGLQEVSDFLSYSFMGGTDLEKVLEHGVELMTGEQYRNADLLLISDFIAPRQSQALEDKIRNLQGHHNRFHSLCLSKYGNPEVLALFDCQWRYHPSAMGRLLKKPIKHLKSKMDSTLIPAQGQQSATIG
ncbi:ATPase RavA stimulator ViaA [Vibrio sp. ZSDZ34]|jgi:uncharacterized protein with von Willebrand factor type A (vWA) domain|uniref:ATPase RavA stimulator ViaA n=1 Tax=Vibrio gelatinilyticus TaxID=2893468 RepID=A0A9X1WEW6_9VIBR|nr:ATPase RavA stimulator ViaA [Vibrio gelatinilyticus]MCJ2377070.1 ATPase RavA stimulator ViaA [Vibrio gelatinilyticus]